MRNLHSLRQTPSVDEGITSLYASGGVTVVCYEPGNMTRYVLTFAKVPSGSCQLLAVDPGGVVVSDINRQSTHAFQPKGLLHYEYVAEKLKRREPDAIVIAELIGFILSRPVISCEEYTKRVLDAEAEAEAEAAS